MKWLGAAALAASLIATSACSDPAGGGSSSGGKQQVSIVGFSILKTANKSLISDFQKTDAGKNVEFKESYGASGDQARAVIAGLKADGVHLSLEPDMTKLTDEKLVAADWKSGDQGIATQSVVAIVVRKGNPEGIKTWDDLAKPGVKIVTHPRGPTPPPARRGAPRVDLTHQRCPHLSTGPGSFRGPCGRACRGRERLRVYQRSGPSAGQRHW